MKNLIIVVLVLMGASAAFAEVSLPRLFGDNMVLQRDRQIPVWGWADKGETITVRFNKQIKTTKAAKDGTWRVRLDSELAGGPYLLTVNGKNTISLKNVLVGDVWICSGQSNMEFAVNSAANAAEEIKNANNPLIRHVEVPKAMSQVPKDDLERSAAWKVADMDNVGKFSAVAYFYVRKLQAELNIPIGLIHSSWGGTDIEAWISRGALEKSDMFKGSDDLKKKPVDLELLIRERKLQILEKLKEIQGSFPDPADLEQWKAASFDDSKWPQVKIPGYWEQSIENFDGVVWFRKTIELTAAEAKESAVLELARIDDSDDTYINGIKVGAMKDKYNDIRVYPVSAGVLKEGKNVIAVRVEDNGGGGGIYGAPEEVKLTVGDRVLSLASSWRYQVETIFEASSSNSGNVGNPNDYPTLLFNAMIHPLTPYAIKGTIWYQGENNAGRAFQYRSTFPMMIKDWRNHWGQGDFPFYFVQLASWKASNGSSTHGSSWAELREAQALTLSVPNTGMAVTVDIGDTNDIHPKNKQDVGLRLAAVALNKTYGKGNVYSGPVFDSMKVEGSKVLLSFKHADSGMLIKDKYGYLKGFEIAGSDKNFHFAQAQVKNGQVLVWHSDVTEPVAVRYAWADDPNDANLYNKEGFPAVPFRTDQWKGITEKVKYTIR